MKKNLEHRNLSLTEQTCYNGLININTTVVYKHLSITRVIDQSTVMVRQLCPNKANALTGLQRESSTVKSGHEEKIPDHDFPWIAYIRQFLERLSNPCLFLGMNKFL